MKTRPIFTVLCLIVLAGFTWGVIQLFQTRFARGDIYPAYSSLRSDPLGAKAFYQSVARLDQFQVSRNEKSLDQFTRAGDATLFYLGAAQLFWSEKTTDNLEKFIKSGGRLVISFYPQSADAMFLKRKEKARTSPTPAREEDETDLKFFSTEEVAKRWGFNLQAKAELVKEAAKNCGVSGLDPEISWHSALHFQNSEPAWKPVYASAELPVVMERTWGEGTIVLASDSYFLSNEAMRHERHSAFLAWLVGTKRQIIFDETHLGVRANPGVSTLMRRYRLGGLIAGLLVLGALAVWKNAARLVPRREISSAEGEVVVGKDSFGGFVNLIRRNVTPPELLGVCVEEWAKFLPRHLGKSQNDVARVRGIITNADRKSGNRGDAVRAYREVSRTINETKWKTRN